MQVSGHASPITATYEFIGKDGPVEPGTEVILGVSTKGGDAARFKEAAKYVKDGVLLRDLSSAAVQPVAHSSQYMGLLNVSPLKDDMPSVKSGKNPLAFHASDMRYLLGKADEDEEAIELLEDFVGEANIFDLLSIFDIDSGMNEISSMASGAIQGAMVGSDGTSWNSDATKKFNKKQKEISKLTGKNLAIKENVDISTIDDVMRLIMEKGIMR